jgi:hypothetical protein
LPRERTRFDRQQTTEDEVEFEEVQVEGEPLEVEVRLEVDSRLDVVADTTTGRWVTSFASTRWFLLIVAPTSPRLVRHCHL